MWSKTSLNPWVETEFGRGKVYDTWGHIRVKLKYNGEWQNMAVHRLAYEKYKGPIPKDYDVHHIDNNPANNHPDNLVAITKRDHRRIHNNWVMVNGEWVAKPCPKCKVIKPLSEYYKSHVRHNGLEYEPKCKPCQREKALKYFNDKKNATALQPTSEAVSSSQQQEAL